MKKMLSALLVWITALFAPAAVQAAPPNTTNNGPKTHQTERPGQRSLKKEGPQTKRGRHQVPRRRKKVMLADGSEAQVDQTEEVA